MLTPQQIQEISFEKAIFGGYDMDSVDDVLEPLTEDYVTLYKENSVLKSKMRILVEKLEEYRNQETSAQAALLAAQKTCNQMIAEAEQKCAKLMHSAEQAAAAKSQNVDTLVSAEQDRLNAAKSATAQFLDGMEKRLKRQLELIDELRKEVPLPKEAAERAQSVLQQTEPEKEPPKRAFDFDAERSHPSTEEKADALIEEIGQKLEKTLTGVTAGGMDGDRRGDTRKLESLHGAFSSGKNQKKFENLQFGQNYSPADKR